MKKVILKWFLKGAVMGAADAVPGVSGGTMALITGIYERLISALASFRVSMVRDLARGEFASVWIRVDGGFLLTLGAGILTSLFSVLSLVHWLLESYPQMLWSFFLGLIAASLIVLVRRQVWHRLDAALMLAGTLIAGGIAFSTGLHLEVTPPTLILGGALAISAMLLPGISGSFILLLLGLYPAVVEAVHQRDLMVVGWVALGCVIGILVFSRVLNWLLRHWHDRVLGFMLGFILGALVKVWPWQYEQQWLLPGQFEQVTGHSALLTGCVFAVLLGALTVIGLTWKSETFSVVKS